MKGALEGCAAVVIPAGVPRKPGTVKPQLSGSVRIGIDSPDNIEKNISKVKMAKMLWSVSWIVAASGRYTIIVRYENCLKLV